MNVEPWSGIRARLRGLVPRRRATRIALVLGVPAAAAVAAYLVLGPRDARLTLSPERVHQTLNGWEVTARGFEMDKKNDRYDGAFGEYSQQIMTRLVDELGVNRIRIEVRSGTENPVDYWSQFMRGEIGYQGVKQGFYEKINDNDDPSHVRPEGFQWSALDFQVETYLKPMRERVERNGEKLSVNLCYVDFKWTEQKGTLRHAERPAEYAELIAATFERLRTKFDITPDWFEVILEPDNSDDWRGAQISAGARAAMARLSQLGTTPKVIAPSTASPHETSPYFDAMLEAGKPPLDVVAYHRYSPIPALAALPGIRKRAAEHDLQTAMLEHTDGNYLELHEDLKVADASAWQMYSIAARASRAEADAYGGFHVGVDPDAPEHERVWMSTRSKLLMPYFRNLRMGAKRLGASSDESAHDPLLFQNRDARYVLLVRSTRGGELTLRGLPQGAYAVTHTAEDGLARELPDVDTARPASVRVHVPAAGVTALLQRNPA